MTHGSQVRAPAERTPLSDALTDPATTVAFIVQPHLLEGLLGVRPPASTKGDPPLKGMCGMTPKRWVVLLGSTLVGAFLGAALIGALLG